MFGLDISMLMADTSGSGVQEDYLSGQSLDEQMTRSWLEMQAFQQKGQYEDCILVLAHKHSN